MRVKIRYTPITMESYDVVFVGAGIASLYAAYRLLQHHPGARVLLLEKEDRIGGRAHNVRFHGVEILEGAGIGRYRKDRLLRKLMTELDIPIHAFSSTHASTFHTVDVELLLAKLKSASRYFDRNTTTFATFARGVLGTSAYYKFKQAVGYTDFENADLIDTVESYGFDDTLPMKGFQVPWNLLVERLAQQVGHHRIKTSCHVTSVDFKANENCYVTSFHRGGKQERRVTSSTVVLGTTISAVKALLPNIGLYDHVLSQPFLRVYAKLSNDDAFARKISTYTVVKGHLQKIIPINPQKGIYMIAYADNRHASALAPFAHDKAYMQRELRKATGVSDVRIEDMHVKYWNEGTHYYSPLPSEFKTRRAFVHRVQRPMPNLFVVGESVALRYQGWTQGALESAHAVLPDIISTNE